MSFGISSSVYPTASSEAILAMGKPVAFEASAEEREAFARFACEHAGWLEDFALYQALRGAHRGKAWYQWPRAICQYTVGHRERLQQVEARLSDLPGLFVTGNSYRGVALNDCTHNAVQIAEALTRYLAPPA